MVSKFVVSAHVDQMLNKEHRDFFSSIVANPGQVNAIHAEKLEKLIEVYPQIGILRALLARALKNGEQPNFELKLKTAATYTPDRAVLYYIINKPEALLSVQKHQVVPYIPADISAKVLPDEIPTIISDEVEVEFTSFDEEKHLAVNEDTPAANEDQDTFDDINQLVAATAEENEINYFHDKDESAVSSTVIADKPLNDTEIDDEVFEEITGIEDIHFNDVNYFKPIVEEEAITEDDEGIFVESEKIHPVETAVTESVITEDRLEEKPNIERRLNLDDEAEKLILGNIAASNYFLFDSKFGERMETASPAKNNKEEEISRELKTSTEAASLNYDANSDVSKYHDDKMPFSFMWWLDKTRKEHDVNYQPYKPYKSPVNPGVNKVGIPGELQYQYYENIIHSTDIEGIVNDKEPVKFNPDSKEDVIIERFIQEDPQIKPPSTDKLDNENKARKSAEDQDEMVTETLARIYVDQMLYHKAISTYKKLMLKFPEKSSYFVAQIELLEKKTN